MVAVSKNMIAITRREFDPIEMEVFSNRLLSITEDMGSALIRSSFSTNIKERKDCSVGLFDAAGRCIAQASHLPMHLGSLWGSTLAVLRHIDAAAIRDGDVFMCNDSYLANGTHQPDIAIVTPVFWDGDLKFFAANVGHHADVGGTVPGSIYGGAKSIFEEGIRIPVIRICRAGKLDTDLLNLVAHNTREPEDRELDIKAQIATNSRGRGMLEDLIAQTGIAKVERAVDDLLEYTERRARNRIAALPDGSYNGSSTMDDDGMGGDPIAIQATVTVAGDRLSIDFEGSARQARGAMNLPDSALKATAYYAVKVALDPNIPPNSGFFNVVEVTAPLGTIVNPKFPGAVGARSITGNKVAGAILSAFSTFLPPHRAMAASHDAVPAMVFSGERKDHKGTYVYLETMAGGNGARHDHDGMEAIHVHVTNTSNLPIEALENEYGLLVQEYALVEDSGGAGIYRGGMGLARQIQSLEDGVVFSARAENHVVSAPGIFGGAAGSHASITYNIGLPNQKSLDSKVAYLVMKKGDSIRLETAGGGGFGPPSGRSVKTLAEDLRGGKVSREAALRDYGEQLVIEALAKT
jgi:N-methylhydantoinase B